MNAVTETELKQHQKNVGGKRVTLEGLEANIKDREFIVVPGSMLTICVLTLQNGFNVTGESACADPAMFNAEIGQRVAEDNAKRKIWPLMGYALKQELFLVETGDSFQDRVRDEARALQAKIIKLDAFLGGAEQFKNLPDEDQILLSNQRLFMGHYYDTLMARIARF